MKMSTKIMLGIGGAGAAGVLLWFLCKRFGWCKSLKNEDGSKVSQFQYDDGGSGWRDLTDRINNDRLERDRSQITEALQRQRKPSALIVTDPTVPVSSYLE